MRWPTPPTGPDGAGITNTAPRPATTPATELGSHDQRSRRVGGWRGAVGAVRFQPPPVKPCMRFSRTRLTDVLHRRRSAFQAQNGLGGTTIPSGLIRPRWLSEFTTWVMPQPQARRRLPRLDSHSASRAKA